MRNRIRRFLEKAGLAALALATLALLVSLASLASSRMKPREEVTIASGDARDESHLLLRGLKTVMAKRHPEVRLQLRTTTGSAENLQLLEAGQAQLAVTLSGIAGGGKIASVARLYEETCHFVVQEESEVERFADLRGLEVAVAKTEDAYEAFVSIAAHHGFKPEDFSVARGDSASADLSFRRAEADARFLLRPLKSESVTKLVTGGKVLFVPLDQAIKNSVTKYTASLIPARTYRSDLPAAEVPTLAIQRLLVARLDADPLAVRAIVETLIEARDEVAEAVSPANKAARALTSQFSHPVVGSTEFSLPIHSGAATYFNAEAKPFIERNARAILLTIAWLLVGAVWAAILRKRRLARRQARPAPYDGGILALAAQVEQAASLAELDAVQRRLTSAMIRALDDLKRRKISEASFQSMNTFWQAASAAVRERRAHLADVKAAEVKAAAIQPEAVASEPEKPAPARGWSMSEYFRTQASS